MAGDELRQRTRQVPAEVSHTTHRRLEAVVAELRAVQGAPGFVQVLGERRLAWPDYAGNAMFQTLGNLASDPRAGLVFADFATGDVLQLSGRARVDWDPARAARVAGAERVVEFDIEAVRETRGALPLRSQTVEPSPFNP